jgi:hypothetical protein
MYEPTTVDIRAVAAIYRVQLGLSDGRSAERRSLAGGPQTHREGQLYRDVLARLERIEGAAGDDTVRFEAELEAFRVAYRLTVPRFTCGRCSLDFQWPGQRDHHAQFSHGVTR